MEKDRIFLKRKKKKGRKNGSFSAFQKELQTMEVKPKTQTHPLCRLGAPEPSGQSQAHNFPSVLCSCMERIMEWFRLEKTFLCVFLPLFLPFRSSVASGQTLIHPDSSAHLPALVWQPADSLIKVPGALLVQLVACKLINRFPVFNSFWECSGSLWALN